MIFSDSPLGTHHKEIKQRLGWFIDRIMCQNGTTCLHMDLFKKKNVHAISNSTNGNNFPILNQGISSYDWN